MSPENKKVLTAVDRKVVLSGLVLLVIWLVLLLAVWVMTGNALLEKFGFRTKEIWVKAIE